MPPSSAHHPLLILRHFRLGMLPPALYQTEILSELGVPVLVWEFGFVEEEIEYVSGPISKIRCENRWVRFFPKRLHPLLLFLGSAVQLIKLIQKNGKPKLVLTHGPQEQVLALMMKYLFDIPFGCHLHEIWDRREVSIQNRFFLFWEKAVLGKADFLIFPEKQRSEIYRQRFQLTQPIYIVYNCPRRLKSPPKSYNLKKELNLSSQSRLMGYWGGIGRLNALEPAIETLSQIPELYFLIWGWGEASYVNELKALAEKYKVSQRLLFLGELGSEKLAKIAGLDLGYCVYRPETELRGRFQATASNKLMESLAVGVPVLTSDNLDFREFLKEFNVGRTSPITADKMSQVIKRIFENSDSYLGMSMTGVKSHLNVLNYESQFQKMLNVFRRYVDFPAQDIKESSSSVRLP